MYKEYNLYKSISGDTKSTIDLKKTDQSSVETDPCMEYNINLVLEYSDGTKLEGQTEFGPYYKVPYISIGYDT